MSPMRARERSGAGRSGAERDGAGRRGDATNRYQRSRIIIIDAGRGDGRGKTHADFYYIFFYLLFPNRSKRSSERSVNIHLYFRFSIE